MHIVLQWIKEKEKNQNTLHSQRPEVTPIAEALTENPAPLTVGSHILEWFGVHYLNALIYMENPPALPFAVLFFITEVSYPHLVSARGIDGL